MTPFRKSGPGMLPPDYYTGRAFKESRLHNNVSIMLTGHAIWAGNRQPPYGQNCGTLKDDTSCTMIILCLNLKFCCAYQVIGAQ